MTVTERNDKKYQYWYASLCIKINKVSKWSVKSTYHGASMTISHAQALTSILLIYHAH